jgi:hypothetical protein
MHEDVARAVEFEELRPIGDVSAEPEGVAERIGLGPELVLELAVADDREAVAPRGALLEPRQRLEEYFGRLLRIETAESSSTGRPASGWWVLADNECRSTSETSETVSSSTGAVPPE